MMLLPEFGVSVGYFFGIAVLDNFAIFNKESAVAEIADVFHGMSDKNDSLFMMFEI